MQNHPRSNFCLLAPAKLFKLLPPFGGVDPAGPGLEWAPTNRNLRSKPTRGALFVCCPTPNYFSWYPYLVGWTLRGPWLEWAPKKLNFTKLTHPKEQLLFAGPRPILIANTSIRWSKPCGPGVEVSPPKIKFSKQTHSKEQLLFAGPHPFVNPSRNFRRGHCAGYPTMVIFSKLCAKSK